MKLNIDGYIIDEQDKWMYDLFEIPYLTLAKMRAFLVEANGDDIELTINCFGGDVWTSAAIYAELRAYSGKSLANIVGLSASASTFLMLGCQKVIASPMASIMIHNAQSSSDGDYREMEHTAAVLKQVDETIRNAYEIKTGKSRDELKKYMDDETWLSPQDALELGIIDEIDLKDGEVLSDPKYSMLMPSRMTNCFNPAKMHQLAAKMAEQPKEPEQPKDSRDESRPVSIEQKTRFMNIRRKLYE